MIGKAFVENKFISFQFSVYGLQFTVRRCTSLKAVITVDEINYVLLRTEAYAQKKVSVICWI